MRRAEILASIKDAPVFRIGPSAPVGGLTKFTSDRREALRKELDAARAAGGSPEHVGRVERELQAEEMRLCLTKPRVIIP